MGILIDTSALVDLERSGRDLAGGLPDEPVRFFIPAIVVAEIWIGIELARSEEIRDRRLARVRALLEEVEVLPFTEDLAPTFARMYVDLRKRGTPIPGNDLIVAATALHFDHDLLVGPSDEAHFRLVPGLKMRLLGPAR